MKPEPADDEREAILAALDPIGDRPPATVESEWRRAALYEAVEERHP